MNPVTLESGAGQSLLRDRAYRELKEMLVLQPAPIDPFLSERKLAKQLGMSNTPVRSAIERLEAEGFITISPQQGIVVRDLSMKEIADQYEIRRAVEPYIVAKLAGRIDPKTAARLRSNLEQQWRALETRDVRRSIELDSAFHLIFCEGLDNGEITRTMLQLRDKIHRVILRIARQVPERLAESYAEHARLADAVVSGDATAASSRIVEHLQNGERLLLPAATP